VNWLAETRKIRCSAAFSGENACVVLFAIFRTLDPDTPSGDPSMSLSLTDIARLSKLAQLDLDGQQAADALDKLNSIFALVEQMKSVDTTGVEPLSHPIAAWQNDLALRLRDDEVSETNQRDAYQKPAPLTQDGLYLVPKVIE
jgi:aspartyl-tRNA(Asn)/glutamyl-tRNA(Gln) amidotransferase subunit C